jgi:UDP-N-acetylglucosamine 2-epimerase (non-hydrolysing)
VIVATPADQMRVMTLFGTRPEIIRLSRVIELLDRMCEHMVVHTGQNYDPMLSDVFFRELRIRKPDVHLGIKAVSFPDQAGQILVKSAEVFAERKPDRLLILGDTNSGLSAITAARASIPVFHMEAGNRCYDDRVPEEINRRIIDHCSNVLMPYTERSKENLVHEGIERERIYVTGNPICEVLEAYGTEIDRSDVLLRLGITRCGYFLVTLHRAENVDQPERLRSFVRGLSAVSERWQKVTVVSVHPRTADFLGRHGIAPSSDRVRLLPPLGFFDFVHLEKNALCVLSDSGTVQEECAIFNIPNVTLRDVTERPETVECGSNILSGASPERIVMAVQVALETGTDWNPPVEYKARGVARTVAKIVVGYSHELDDDGRAL